MQRIRHFLNTLQTNWSEDPASRGAAKMTAGAVLVAEGLFGIARRALSRGRGRGRRGRGGLLGGVIGLVIGIVFIVIGAAMAPDAPDDEVAVTGRIVEVETSRNNDGETRFSPIYSYQVEGREYRLHSAMRSSVRPQIGSEVRIGYSAANPENARRTDGLESRVHWLFAGAGIILLAVSLVSLAISIALIVFGIMLFRSGRADRRAAGEPSGFISDLVSLASRAGRGEIDVEQTAAGRRGDSQGGMPEPG